MLTTLKVNVVGKDNINLFPPFPTIDELIASKQSMRKPPPRNVPIKINKIGNTITVSARLSNPSQKHNIGHDPNIGALSLICQYLRVLGWTKNITITHHDVSQEYVTKNLNNKFLQVCNMLNISLKDLKLTAPTDSKDYW